MHPTAHDPDFEKRYLLAAEKAREYSDALAGPSLAEQLGTLTALELEELLAGLTKSELARLRYHWPFWARPKQNPDLSDVPHRILFWLGGRGSGKTLAGAQHVRYRINAGARSIAFVGPTKTEIERYMIYGDGGSDGILTVFPPHLKPEYKAHKQVIFFHRPECEGCGSAQRCGGAVAYVNSAEEPELRGPNLDTVWCDEPGKWRYLAALWTNIELATRLRGAIPTELTITGTPLPLPQFRKWIADEECITISMKQSENAVNLEESYVGRMQRVMGGTRRGRQELDGEVLTDNPGALFSATNLEATRVTFAPEFEEVAVAVDPAIATNPENDETGIIAGGRDYAGHIFITLDASGKYSPEAWGSKVVQTCTQLECDTVVGERNRGGDLVAANVRAAKERKHGAMAAKGLRTVDVLATRGKAIRAEPVSSIAEKGYLHIVGRWPELEGEMTEWDPTIGGLSPNRLDALVWLVWYLAKLGEAEKPDYRAGFTGLSAAAAQLRAPASVTFGGLAAALPRGGRGSML